MSGIVRCVPRRACRHDAECAILIAPLHDADERRDLQQRSMTAVRGAVTIRQVFANRRFTAAFFLYIDDLVATSR